MHLKICCFGWLSLEGNILTWNNLLKRGFSGSCICLLCKQIEETITQMFFQCHFVQIVWSYIGEYLNIIDVGPSGSLQTCLLWWKKNNA